jgi:hypothetical protein
MISNLLSSKTKKRPEYSIDYKDENTYFTILSGKYQNVTVTYSQTQFFEDEGFARLKFNYHVIDFANFTEEGLTDDQEFVTILGDILQDYILIEAKKLETTRKRHSEELDFQ